MNTIDENKRVARRILTEVVGGGRFELIDELVGDEFITKPPDGPPGPDGYRAWVTGLRVAFPDLTMEIDDQVGEGSKVATRFTARATHGVEYLDVPPTGRKLTTPGVVIHEVRGGKIVNFWLFQDDLGTVRQLTAPADQPAG